MLNERCELVCACSLAHGRHKYDQCGSNCNNQNPGADISADVASGIELVKILRVVGDIAQLASWTSVTVLAVATAIFARVRTTAARAPVKARPARVRLCGSCGVSPVPMVQLERLDCAVCDAAHAKKVAAARAIGGGRSGMRPIEFWGTKRAFCRTCRRILTRATPSARCLTGIALKFARWARIAGGHAFEALMIA